MTLDGRGEFDSTVVWHGTPEGLERIRTYKFPNSLGRLYGGVTRFLGYEQKNGEGKVMGLAPYGNPNKEIETTLRGIISTGVDYDVTSLTTGGYEVTTRKLEYLFNRERNRSLGEFGQWEQDLARVTQELIEEIVCDIVSYYLNSLGTSSVCLAGGVALNCKMNKEIRETEGVDEVYIQPAANDAGLAVGAALLDTIPREVDEMESVYYGPSYELSGIESILEQFKIDYKSPDQLEQYLADQLVNGKLVGWYQGRMELGPRALGNRSILADPRSEESRDRVNDHVKNRENWRPFAPSILAEAADDFLEDSEPSPFMIKTFDVRPEKRDEIPAVIHPSDSTTRPQTVRKEHNRRYWTLLKEFEKRTGVPVLLNTSFNDHGEPIVESPKQAIRAFFSMGLDTLVLGDFVVEK